MIIRHRRVFLLPRLRLSVSYRRRRPRRGAYAIGLADRPHNAALRRSRIRSARDRARPNTAHADRQPIHLKTPYGWLGNGDVPRSPVDRIVVDLLSEALSRPVSYRDTWFREPTPATTGLDVAWTTDGMPRLLKEWSMLDRREFTAGWGVALLQAAGNALQTQPGGPAAAPAPAADDELLHLVDAIVTRSRALDDHHGSAAASFVGDPPAHPSTSLRSSRTTRPDRRVHGT
jgi:hypothetical protein